ncbi:DUF4136 domain-containing protein [Occallatibacter riparius]|uniref:DUF4136 domain-containing protein n=1 Tax=Occallatibacter riparius TaxID=1002689 RepID=A0A9J7BIR2_9BACT|nr:DUF4136 domain-containing protein [Occallatibacter riparius]UWZ82387.1 DUF4136 domain-containing protein [Occallatibacter riparius]
MFVRGRGIAVVVLTVALGLAAGFAQKTKVGFDKTADFSKYKSFSVQKPAKDPAHPLLYVHIVGAIEQELAAKGMTHAETDGDLVLMLTGGTDFGLENAPTASDCANCKAPILDPGDWPGNTAPPGVGSKPMPEGMVELNFVDRATNKSVWMGWVEQKLDPDKKSKAFDQADKAIQKLLKDFPPKK